MYKRQEQYKGVLNMDDVQPIPIPEEPLPNRHVDEIRFSGEEILASDFSDVRCV